jgi:hypothetical protein
MMNQVNINPWVDYIYVTFKPYSMKTSDIYKVLVCIILVTCFSTRAQSQAKDKFLLQKNWTIQSSQKETGKGEQISTTAFRPEAWYPATVPSTWWNLVENKLY